MKLIKKGVPPKDELWKGACSICKSQYEATKNEIKDQIKFSKTIHDHAKAVCEICGSNFYLYPVNSIYGSFFDQDNNK
jgi:hypothetical protein